MRKIAEVTFLFWIMKICATTLGEHASDFLSMELNANYPGSLIKLATILLILLIVQLSLKRNIPLLYWIVITVASSVASIMTACMDRKLGLGYINESIIFLTILLSILAFWKMNEKSLMLIDIKSFKSELFYWFAILFSDVLGTSLNHALRDVSGIGFATGTFLTGGLLALLVLYSYSARTSPILLFWCAFVLTHPLGSKIWDWLSDTLEKDEIGFGIKGCSLIVLFILVFLILYTSIRNTFMENEGYTK